MNLGKIRFMPPQLREIGCHVENHATQWHGFQHDIQFQEVVVAWIQLTLEFNGLLSFPLQIHLKFRLKSKIFYHLMITLNFSNKPSTKAIFSLPIQIKLSKGPCIKLYLHNYP